jgi:hypothetical protein
MMIRTTPLTEHKYPMMETKLGYQCLIVCRIGVLYYELRVLASIYALFKVLTDSYKDL